MWCLNTQPLLFAGLLLGGGKLLRGPGRHNITAGVQAGLLVGPSKLSAGRKSREEEWEAQRGGGWYSTLCSPRASTDIDDKDKLAISFQGTSAGAPQVRLGRFDVKGAGPGA